jgi:hypothetical protein
MAGSLSAYHSTVSEGVLDTVKKDRQADLRMEPTYIAANNDDNAKSNQPILEFTNPYVAKQK